MLDDEHAVALVDEAAERLEQALVVARVQADARFVEHVEHADERGADLRGQADALALAAGKRVRRAIERQVVEADVDEEVQPLGDGLQQRHGDGGVAAAELRALAERHEELPQRAERHGAELADVLAAEPHRERFGAKPHAVARLAGLRHDEAAEVLGADRAVVVSSSAGFGRLVGVEHAPAAAARCPRSRRPGRGLGPSAFGAAVEDGLPHRLPGDRARRRRD